MVKLLVIADDFTGALDTGVQFKARGTLIRIGLPEGGALLEGRDVQVLIVDAETRHMAPDQAMEAVRSIVAAAERAGVSCIYKKTDSALRGNIGSELTAMLQAGRGGCVHFIPAFPRMNRRTVNGVHYIDGRPVAESVFGTDPFEPVRFSAVGDIIASQSGAPTHLIGPGGSPAGREGILVYDAETDQDLHRIARSLRAGGGLHLLAGCAGFAAELPGLLGLEQSAGGLPPLDPRLLAVSGSINPITLEQLDAAERAGVPRIRLTPRQKLEPGWLESGEGRRTLSAWLKQVESSPSAIIECGGGDGGATDAWARARGMTGEQTRRQVCRTMGAVLQALLDRGLERTLLLTGGDTLRSFMEHIGQDELTPLGELAPGVVLSQVRYRSKTFNMISKSGGFGGRALLKDLEDILSRQPLFSQEEASAC